MLMTFGHALRSAITSLSCSCDHSQPSDAAFRKVNSPRRCKLRVCFPSDGSSSSRRTSASSLSRFRFATPKVVWPLYARIVGSQKSVRTADADKRRQTRVSAMRSSQSAVKQSVSLGACARARDVLTVGREEMQSNLVEHFVRAAQDGRRRTIVVVARGGRLLWRASHLTAGSERAVFDEVDPLGDEAWERSGALVRTCRTATQGNRPETRRKSALNEPSEEGSGNQVRRRKSSEVRLDNSRLHSIFRP